MLRWWLWTERLLAGLTSLSAVISGASMALLIALVFGNMAGRYVFGVGTTWLQELEMYVLALTVMTSIAYAMRHDDHVRIDIFYSQLSHTGRLWLDSLTMLFIALPIAVLVLYYSWPYVQTSWARGERSPNAGGLPWRFLPKGMILVGFALIFAEALRQAMSGFRRLFFHYRRPGQPVAPGS
ncbi:MAG: TRAP transporter small permease subunit [Thioalkalivibrio sp.]|nr:MAG: TRAP transporter small permease subunit [Thioalkalivibrio sp.]